MAGIDPQRPFVPLKIAVLTVSDTRELADDKSGATLAERIEKAGHAVAARAIVSDDVENIRAQRFYARYGFREVGRYEFRVGDQIDDDRIWSLDL